MKTLFNLKHFVWQLLVGSFILVAFNLTTWAQSIDTLVVNFNPDYFEVLTNSTGEINPLENDNCSDPANDLCPELLASLYISDYTQPEHGVVTLAGNYFIYTPDPDYEGYDWFVYDVEGANGTMASLLIPINVGPIDEVPFPPCDFNIIANTPPLSCPFTYAPSPCNLICNSSIGTNGAGNINTTNTPHWFGLQISPNTTTSDLFGINCGVMNMWRQIDNYGEAAATRLNANVTPAYVYLLTYTRRNPSTVITDQFITRLDHFGVVTSANFTCAPPTFPNSFVIDNDPNILPGATAQRVANCFGISSDSYDQLTIYPRQTVNPQLGVQTNVVFDQIELCRYPLPVGYYQEVQCGQSITIDAPCHNTGTSWQWIDQTTGGLLYTGDSYPTNPITQDLFITLQLNINADIINCGPGISYTYAFHPVDCCCDNFVNSIVNSPIGVTPGSGPTTFTFTPPNLPMLPTDVVQWDFNCDGIIDNTTTGATPVQYTYPSPGACNYVACMKAMRVDAQGDTCWAIQTKYMTIPENCSSCLSFDGTDDRISVPNSSALLDGLGSGNFTFEAKIKIPPAANALTTNPAMFSNRSNSSGGVVFFIHNIWSGSAVKMLALQIGGNNYFITTGGGNNGIDLLDDVCHHVAVSKSNDTLRFYIDGAYIGFRTVVNASISTGNNILIGNDVVSSSHKFMGTMSDLRIWSTTRSQAQIQSNMNNSAPVGTGLLANWPLHEGIGQNVSDIGPSAYNGILGTNNTTEGTDPSWGADCCNVCPPVCTNTGCNCDDEFYSDVALGFTSFFNGLTGIFIPIGDFDNNCDNVLWTWGSSGSTSSIGNQSVVHTFPNNGGYQVCMIVSRDINQDGIIDCIAEYCIDVNVEDNSCCKCDQDFFDEVAECFTYTQIGNTLSFTPNGSFGTCDEVFWDFGNGNNIGWLSPVNQTISNTYTSSGSYTVCMIVQRTLPNGEICTTECCFTITVLPIVEPCPCDDNFYNQVGLCFNYTNSSNTFSFIPNGTFGTCDVVRWSFGNGNLSNFISPVNQTVTQTYSSFGTYNVCMLVMRTQSDGIICETECCIDITFATVCPMDITFNDAVALCFEYSQVDDSFDFTPSGSFGICDSVSWNFGDGTISGWNSPVNQSVSHIYDTPGSYEVQMTVIRTNELGDTSVANCTETVVYTGIDDPGIGQRIYLYPNPAQNQLYITISGLHQEGIIEITDIQGKVIAQCPVATNQHDLVLPISSLPPAMYMLLLKSIDRKVLAVEKWVKN